MSGLRFQDPLWLAALLPALLLVWWSVRRRRRTTVTFSSVAALRELPVSTAQRLRRLLPVLRFLGLGCLILALARPQRGREEYRVRTEGISIMMCLDRSGSMEAMDFEEGGQRVRRLDVVKRVFRDFVSGAGDLEGRPDDFVGLVAFGGFAESLCPLTLDHGALLEILDTVEIPVPIRDRTGKVVDAEFHNEELSTAIGDALARGVDRLAESPTKSKVLILLSDGSNNAGVVDPRAAAEAAKELGIKVYTIGVGSTGMAPFPEMRGGQVYLVSRPVEMDEELLREIAETTGGRAFNVRDTDALEDVYAVIDELEKTRSESLLYTEYRELYAWWLIPGAALLVLRLLLGATRFSSLP
jgi:Ca-activated chloride channel family protein